MATEMKRRQFLAAFAAAAGGALLASCAPTAAPAPKEESREVQAPKDEVPQPVALEPVTITMHIAAGWEETVPGMYVRRPLLFMQQNPDIKIEMVPIPGGEYDAKLLTMAAAGTIGDTMHTSDVWTHHTRMVKTGTLRSVDEHLDAHGISKDEWVPAAIDTITYEGKIYGLPKTCHPGDAYIWVNEDLFQAAGIPIPEVYGNTFESISEWAEKVCQGPDDDRQVYGLMPVVSGIQAIVNGVRQFGTYENNAEGTESLCDNDQWFEWAQWVRSFFGNKTAAVEASLPTGGSVALFLAGKLGMCHSQRFMYRRVVAGMTEVEKPFNWRVIQFPRGPQAKGWGASVDTHSVSTNCKHPEEAFRVIYAMADQTFALFVAEDQGYLTARVDDLETVRPIIYPFLELQYQCVTEQEKFHQPSNARGREVETVYVNELNKIWAQEETLTADFMTRVKSAVDEVLAKPF